MMRGGGVAVVALAVIGWQGPARASDKQACLDASSQGQTLRDAHKLLEARDQFRACARASCPDVVASWLNQVDKDVPSLALTAKDGDGNDLVDVKVTLDGTVVATKLDGHSVEVNAGPHSVRFELADGTAVDEQVLTHEGDKNHVVNAVLRKAAPPPPTPAVVTPAIVPPSAVGSAAVTPAPDVALGPATSAGRGQRTVGLVVGGVGVAGLVVGSIFGVNASSKWSSAKKDCQPGACGPGSPSQTEKSDASSAATVSTRSPSSREGWRSRRGQSFSSPRRRDERRAVNPLRVCGCCRR